MTESVQHARRGQRLTVESSPAHWFKQIVRGLLEGIFAQGQVYVLVSRVTDPRNFHLLGLPPIDMLEEVANAWRAAGLDVVCAFVGYLLTAARCVTWRRFGLRLSIVLMSRSVCRKQFQSRTTSCISRLLATSQSSTDSRSGGLGVRACLSSCSRYKKPCRLGRRPQERIKLGAQSRPDDTGV